MESRLSQSQHSPQREHSRSSGRLTSPPSRTSSRSVNVGRSDKSSRRVSKTSRNDSNASGNRRTGNRDTSTLPANGKAASQNLSSIHEFAHSHETYEPEETPIKKSLGQSLIDDFDTLLRGSSALTQDEITQIRHVFVFISSSTNHDPDPCMQQIIDAGQARYSLTQMGFDAPMLDPETGRLIVPGVGNFKHLSVESFLQTAGAVATATRERLKKSAMLRGPEKAATLFRLMDPGNKKRITPVKLLRFLHETSKVRYTIKAAKRVCQAISRTNSDEWFDLEDLKWYTQSRRFALQYTESTKIAAPLEPDVKPQSQSGLAIASPPAARSRRGALQVIESLGSTVPEIMM